MSNYLDELTAFLLKENKNMKNLSIYDKYNRFVKKTKNKIKNEADVVRCLNLIKRSEVIDRNSNLMHLIFQEETVT